MKVRFPWYAHSIEFVRGARGGVLFSRRPTSMRPQAFGRWGGRYLEGATIRAGEAC